MAITRSGRQTSQLNNYRYTGLKIPVQNCRQLLAIKMHSLNDISALTYYRLAVSLRTTRFNIQKF
jgi:hypothetical protein